MALTVCGVNLSPFVRKIRVQLIEKGVPHDVEPLNPFQAGDDFTAINPLRRIPLLKDADVGPDFTLPDSSAIAHYIERKHPDSPMMPESVADYGRALWLEEYADTELAGKVGIGVFRPMVFPQLAGGAPDMASAAEGARKLARLFDYLESQIEGRDWFAGDRFSLADISVATHFVNLGLTGVAPASDRWPALDDFLSRAFARESFRTVNAEHAEMDAGLAKLNVPAEELWS
ncbi:glutathione S-transferase family protein [Kordiimonas marina]|uniref:glutathione S-transferase family protein n=1 Tax=Kordiimonas marina TaxID=2872312 RepID=UPI001FF3095C|nr:glutathione S-transferase family protein [Kordiimonas marina]MCJ9427704.1 glutathione S-transferase family protein [Kordiimonas marina]